MCKTVVQASPNATMFKDTTDLMVYGHEAWLEAAGSHGHTGEKTNVYLKWGHNMKSDGLASRDNIRPFVILPDGAKQDAAVEEGTSEYHLVNFTPDTDGFYQVVTRHEGNYALDEQGKYLKGTRQDYPQAQKAVCYHQFAQLIVSVGHHLEGTPPAANTELEIRANHWQSWRAGETIKLVVYHQGQPVDGISVDIISDGPAGYQQQEILTGANGDFTVSANVPGRYLVVARYRLPVEGNNQYEELSLTATLGFMVTK